MFGSNPFGQSSSSPFGSQPVFGQTNNATNNSNNPFAPKPFGGSTPFGSQTGSSIFGSMSTGVFGSQSSSPLGSTSVFGASSPAFGNSAPAFGASTGASPFGQPKPAFGGFGSNTTPTSPFGQQSQPAFGSSPFGAATPFSAPSQPAFGASSSSPAFGNPSPSPFGGTSASAFGSTASPGFGNTSGGFGSSPFGSAPTFGVTPTPGFGGTSSPAFGTTATPTFGSSTTPGFGSTTTSAFGATTSAPAFGNSTSAFNFGSSPGFGQSTSAFGNSTFGTSSFGSQSSAFGSQSSTPALGQSTFGAQRVGSRVAPFTATPETDAGAGTPGKLESISAMPVYKEKSHEELRWEDYQAGDKGGPSPAGQSTSAFGFSSPGMGSSAPSLFTQSSANPFSSSTSTNPFAPKAPVNNSAFGSSSATGFGSSPFGQSNTSNLFGSTSSATTSLFGPTTQTFGVNTSSPNPFNSAGASGFGSQSIFNSTAQGTTSTFGTGLAFGNTQSSPLFQSSTPALAQTSSPFGQNTSAFGQTTPAFGQTTTSAFGQQSNMFNAPSTGFGGSFFSSTPSLLSNSNPMAGFGQTAPSLTTPFQSSQPAQSSGGFSFSNFGQTQAVASSGFGGTPGLFGQNTFGQSPAPQSNVITQAAPITNPFGTLPAMPQMSIGRPGSSPSIQYGISSLPVVEKPVAPRISSLLTSRHISQRRMALPIRRYHPNTNGPKVAFFNDDEETPSTPKADALFVPRENPRALVIRPMEQWPSRSSTEKTTPSNVKGTFVRENGASEESLGRGLAKEKENPVNGHVKANGVQDTGKGDSFVTLTGHRAGEAAIVYEHGADIEALMPKLRHSDYYTEPRIQEIAAKERADPGYCRQVKDFIVGRHGYGSIKFFGETDVRRLDLESLVQFNNREVIVYMDESKKPPVGQGLNKPAEVTLLNIKCVDKKSGQQYTEGPRVDKYKEMLKRKAEDQGAEFVSYDPSKGEWKFRVHHFSRYKLTEDDDDDDDQSGEDVLSSK